ncbi:unnamed protein product [Linum trigynum]|uniref:Uncharacterized protein n=1 Tax=Linum trigynum TaxID=586398 RepID=A0AAV2GJM3_9ROSI
MDSYEATKTVFSRIQGLDPENASKIMGYLLLQDQGDREMIRLAFGPDSSLHNLILQAKSHLGLPISPTAATSTTTTTTTTTPATSSVSSAPSTPSSFVRPAALSLSRLGDGFEKLGNSVSSPGANSWSILSPGNGNHYNGNGSHSRSGSSSLSYVNGGGGGGNHYGGVGNNNGGNDLGGDEYQVHRDHFGFLNESSYADQVFDPRPDLGLLSPSSGGGYGGGHDDVVGGGAAHFHRRSFSVPGVSFGSDDVGSPGAAGGGFGWKPCLYFAKGFCKNGATCKFLHGGDSSDGGSSLVGSPGKLNEFEQCQELLMRSKSSSVHQQKLAQFMAGSGASSFPYNKCMNLLLQQQSDVQRSAAALMMGDELHKFSRCRPERSTDFSPLGLGGGILNPSARQIYLTFPADSTFREEDVSNYFSIYGPVQDVRIPYQQKRMFGFVTFLYPETVKLILAKGNPHFVCDSRVLVKPYKEKGKIPEKKHQQMERGDFSPSACSSPRGVDSREPFDLQLGSRMLYNTQEMLLRKKLEEQADLQHAIELHGRRLVSLQLMDLKTHHRQQLLNGLSNGSPVSSPTGLARSFSHPVRVSSIDQEGGFSIPEENGGCLHHDDGGAVVTGGVGRELNPSCDNNNNNNNSNNFNKDNGNVERYFTEHNDLQESLEHIHLPDNLFNSPKKAAGDHLKTAFSSNAPLLEIHEIPTASTAAASALSMTPLKSCFPQMPRLSSGHGTIGI